MKKTFLKKIIVNHIKENGYTIKQFCKETKIPRQTFYALLQQKFSVGLFHQKKIKDHILFKNIDDKNIFKIKNIRIIKKASK